MKLTSDRHLEGFRPLCISGDVEVTHGSNLAVKVSGNVLQYKQDPFTGEFLAVTTIRSNEIKEPFVFNAFEDNNMTLFVQAKDQNTPLSGCLSFWRKLEQIRCKFSKYSSLLFRIFSLYSATQQIPLCETRFDVSSGDTSFVIKDQMSWSPSENGTEINGHGFVPNLPRTGATQSTGDEEDPYEKIEIRKAEMPVQPTPPAVETAAKEKSQLSDNKKPELTVKNEARNRSEDPSEKSLSEERFDEEETGIKIICQISEVENKMQFKVEEKIISMKPEEARKEREITRKVEEVNKNCCVDISSQKNLFDVSSERKSTESEDKGQVASQNENEKQVYIGCLFLQYI